MPICPTQMMLTLPHDKIPDMINNAQYGKSNTVKRNNANGTDLTQFVSPGCYCYYF